MIAMNQTSGFATKKSLMETGIGCLIDGIMNNPSFFDPNLPDNGTFPVVGPHQLSRKWWAEVTVVDGKIVKVT
jgi:hypothetical protein